MDFLELAKKRYSVRNFNSKKIESDKLELILEAGRIAPTAVNYQSQRILVIESKEALAKLRKCTSCHYNCTAAILVCYDPSVCGERPADQKKQGEVDASIVCTHMMIEATELGIGSTWVADFNPEKMKEEFNVPGNLEQVALLVLGYPDEKSEPRNMHFSKHKLKETISFNKFE